MTKSFERKHNISPARKWIWWLIGAILLLLVSLGLAWVSTGFQSLQGWLSMLLTGILCTGLLAGAWFGVNSGEKEHLPGGLIGLVLLAITLRIAAGLLWFTALPSLGHGSPTEQAGYIMADAYTRDQAAWELAQSDKPLWNAFQNNRAIDQYGGLFYLSALIYRFLGSDMHQPLQMVMIAAVFSSLAIVFTWAFVRRTLGIEIAWIAAWIIALYPEAILLGSSQMREAFTISLTMMGFYGITAFVQDRSRRNLLWVFGAILFFLPFSPPFAALLAGMLVIYALINDPFNLRQALEYRRQRNSLVFWLSFSLVLILVLITVWLALGQFTPEKITNPVAMVNWWVRKSADWQAHLTERASGKIQAIFDRSPEWLHAPFLIAYGVVQPLLPAAIITPSQASIWQGIAIWRALGWTILLMLLVYATWRAWSRETKGIVKFLIILTWLVIVIASFRGGGDQWDNPRYRATFLGLQVIIAAWAWNEQRRSKDRAFRYVLVWISITVLWFIPWYLYRKVSIPWPIEDLFKTLGLATATTVLYIIYDRSRNQTSEFQSQAKD